MSLRHFTVILIIFLQIDLNLSNENDQCTIENVGEECKSNDQSVPRHNKYAEEHNSKILQEIQQALKEYKPCATEAEEDSSCSCYKEVIKQDLAHFQPKGITRVMLKDSEQFGTLYKVLDHKLYRSSDCMFPARCQGIEHFLQLLLPELPDLDLVINTRDYPQLPMAYHSKRVVFSFSKTSEYADIMYPAWTFWAGGPAITLFPTGIGRWDLLRVKLMTAAEKNPWAQKLNLAFFRGSRTSDERDSLVLLSRRRPEIVDAKYTKNQAWKSAKDTLNEEPASEVSFEDHCQYKYLFNFRGVAASFRYKHLFLCKSLVFHVGDEWNEFFYFALKPWVHYVPIKSHPSENELSEILEFFKKHDNLAQEIAERGYEFIKNHLKLSDVLCYWRQLLLEYKKLLKFTIATNKNLIEIK